MELVKWYEHLKTITEHKIEVMKNCFAVGLYKQGLLHDLSKYTWTEFSMGAKYYQGNRSPNEAEREDKGYKHHLEYWLDYSVDRNQGIVGMPMPTQYVIEMFCDRVAASKIYNKEKYNDSFPWSYYKKGRSRKLLHKDTAALLEKFLKMLSVYGEEYTFAYIKRFYVIPLRRKKAAKLVNILKKLGIF